MDNSTMPVKDQNDWFKALKKEVIENFHEMNIDVKTSLIDTHQSDDGSSWYERYVHVNGKLKSFILVHYQESPKKYDLYISVQGGR